MFPLGTSTLPFYQRWRYSYQLYVSTLWLGTGDCILDVLRAASVLSQLWSTLYWRHQTYLWSTSVNLRVLFRMVGLPKLLILLIPILTLHALFAASLLSLLLVGQWIVLVSLMIVNVSVEHSCSWLLYWWRAPCDVSWCQLTTNQPCSLGKSSHSDTVRPRLVLRLLVLNALSSLPYVLEYGGFKIDATSNGFLYRTIFIVPCPLNIIMLLLRTMQY